MDWVKEEIRPDCWTLRLPDDTWLTLDGFDAVDVGWSVMHSRTQGGWSRRNMNTTMGILVGPFRMLSREQAFQVAETYAAELFPLWALSHG